MSMSEEELRKQQQQDRFAQSQGMYDDFSGAYDYGSTVRQATQKAEPPLGPNQFKQATSSWWNPFSYGEDKVVTAPMPTGGDPFAAERAAAETAGSALYNPNFYRRALDIFAGTATGAEAIAAELEKGVQAAYGQAGAQSRKSAQEMYREGQRTAAEVAGGAEASAARAAGYLSGQGMPQTMVSGLAGTSGGASYDPTMGRAYGGIQAEAIGREAAFAAQEEAARGSGAGRRKSLVDLVTDSNAQMRRQLMMMENVAMSNAETANAAAVKAVNEKAKADVMSESDIMLLKMRADKAWEANTDELEEIFGNKELYDKAVAALVEQRSKAQLTKYWNTISFMIDKDMGSYEQLLPPDADASALMLQQLGLQQ